MADLGSELKQYMINLLNSIEKEVEKQFEKWAKERIGFLAMLCYAQKDAAEEQATVLKEQEEEKRRSFERALFVLEILTIGATAWLGATLEMKLGPKLFREYDKNIGPVLLPKRLVPVDEYRSKIFGDMGKDLADMVFKLAGQQFAPTPYTEANAHSVTYSPDANVFANSLFREVDQQRQQAVAAINKITQEINKSSSFGGALVKRLRQENPHLDRLGFDAQWLAGKKMIDDILNLYRKTWADRWIYYGNDPPEPDWEKVKKELELQIWVIWFIQQNFHVERIGPGFTIVTGASGPVLNQSGGFASSYKDSPIAERLFYKFNAPLMELLHDGLVSTNQLNRLKNWMINQQPTWLNWHLEGVKRKLEPVDQIW